jgi:hypothetical protein
MSISYNGRSKIAELKTDNSNDDDTYSISLLSGSSVDGYSGNVSVRSGSSTNLNSGNINLRTGNSTNGTSGDINLLAGDGYVGGGNINIKPGNGSLDGYIFLKNSNSNNALIIGDSCNFDSASTNQVLAKLNNSSAGYISTVLPSLLINTGTGLTGGGNLTTNRTISIQPGFLDGYSRNTSLDGYVPTSRTITAGTGLSGGGTLAANRTISLQPGLFDGYARNSSLDGYISGIVVRENAGANIGTRPRLNFIEGSNISMTIADDPANNEIDITINSTGGGGGGSTDGYVFQTRQVNTGSGLTGGGDLSANRTISLQPGLLDGYLDGLTVRRNTGSNIGVRPRINFIEGSNISLGITDDPTNDEIDVTISSSATPSASNDGSVTRRYDFTWTGSSIQINVNIATEFGFSEGSFQVEARHILQQDSGAAIYWYQGLTSLRYDSSNNLESRPNFFPSSASWSSLGPTDAMLMDVTGATTVRFTVGVDAGFPTPASGQLAVRIIPINPDMVIPIGSGGGDVIGPTFSTNNSVALFDGYTGKIIKQSSLIFDGYDLSGINDLFLDGNINGIDISAIPSTYALQTRQINAGTGLSGGGNLTANRTISLQPGLLDGYLSGVTVRSNTGSNIGTQPRLNFIEGSNVSMTITNDPGNNEVDITISSSGGGGSLDGYVFQTREINTGSGLVGGGDLSQNRTISLQQGLLDGYATAAFVNTQNNITRAALDGYVRGPVSSTDNTVPRFDLTTGRLIQGSGVVIDDSNNISGVGNITLSGTVDGIDVSTIPSTYALQTRNISAGAGLSGGGNLTADRTIGIQQGLLDGYMRGVIVRENSGANIGTQPRLNFIEGAGVNLSISNDVGGSEIDITIGVNGGLGSGNVVGPGSSTNNAIARYDGYDGYILRNSSIIISNNNTMVFPVVTSPEIPSANNVALFGRSLGGRILPAAIGPSGLDTTLQPHLARNAIAYARANGNSTTLSVLGTAITATGTPTAKNSATTNRYTYMRGIEYLVTVAATTAVSGFRGPAAQFARGAGTSGGFHFICRWGPATGVATATTRGFCGLSAATGAPTDVNPSTLTNIIGMGWDSGDTNIQMMHNDGTGTATRINLGASFLRPTVDRTSVYEIDLFCPPGGSVITYLVIDLVSGAEASGSISTDIPATTQLLNAPYAYNSVGGTSSVIGTCLFSYYIETDY